MRAVICGASGLIGTALVESLVADGHEVTQLVRFDQPGPGKASWAPADGVLDPGVFDGADAVINLSGAGVGNKRWTPEYKRLIRDSRVDSSALVARTIAALPQPPQVYVQASAMGVYGDRDDEVLTEQSVPGHGFLADVVTDWEAAADPACDAGIRTVLMRTGLVAAPDGGAFAQLLPLFKAGGGGRLGDGTMWWSLISLADEVAAFRFVINEASVTGPVNVVCPEPARNEDVTRALGSALNRPTVVPVPKFALRVVLGEFAEDVMASTRVMPQVLLDAGFEFTHPDAGAVCEWLAAQA